MLYRPKESGLRIQKLRKTQGMTQEQLAGKVNISTSTLAKIERGVQSPSIDLLVELSMLLGASLDYIILGKMSQMDEVRKQIFDMAGVLVEFGRKL